MSAKMDGQRPQATIPNFSEDDEGPDIHHIDLDNITFYGKLDEPVHRWFRLTAAFSPELVRHCLARVVSQTDVSVVLDPFCGTGTTLVESRRQGYDAVGVEYNPVYQQVATGKTDWPFDIDALDSEMDALTSHARSLADEWRGTPIEDYEEEFDIYVPNIYNRDRWWHDHALRDLLALREAINHLDAPERHRQFFRVGLMSILIEASNATYNHVSLSYMDDPPEQVDAFGLYQNKVTEMRADVDALDDGGATVADVIPGDSTNIDEYVPENLVDAVITSPPYPNRYSYIRETRPHMFFFDMVDDAGEVGELAMDSVGGTWGRATSSLEGDTTIEPTNDLVADVIGDVAARLAEEDESMRNYVVKYFNKMEHHLQGLEEITGEGCRLAYTVGNSELKGVEIPTDVFLAEMFDAHGFDRDISIARARERNSKSSLYEAIVYATR